MYLLDTSVVSELRKAKSGKADTRVISWAEDREKGDRHNLIIDAKIIKKERKKKYKVSRVDRFRYRCRYFNDAGIIGSKAFVGEVFDQAKHLLRSKDERKFTLIGGVEGSIP